MTGRKGSAAKKSAKQKDAPKEEPVEAPPKDEIQEELNGLEEGSKQLFEGQNSWIHGDNLEVLRLKVASSILDECKQLETVAPSIKESNGSANLTSQGQNGMSSREKAVDEDQTTLDKLVDELMYLAKPELTMRNKVGLASSMQQNNFYSDSTKQGQAVVQNSNGTQNNGIVAVHRGENNGVGSVLQVFNPQQQKRMGAILIDKIKKIPKPTWHAPWKLKKVFFIN